MTVVAGLPEIVGLNPSLLRMTTPRDMPFDLHIPVGTSEVFASRIKQIPEDKRDTWRFHVVHDGETLDGIATTFHTHASDIAEENGVTGNDSVDAGDELVIPIAAPRAVAHPQTYKVRRGDTLVTVADRFGVTVEQLRSWNHLRSNAVATGRSLRVSEPVKLAPRMRGRSSRGRAHSRTSSTSAHSKSHASGRSATKKSSSKSNHSSSKTKKKATR